MLSFSNFFANIAFALGLYSVAVAFMRRIGLHISKKFCNFAPDFITSQNESNFHCSATSRSCC